MRVCVCACWCPTSSDLVGLLRRNKNPSGRLGLDLVSPCTLTCPGCGGGGKRNNNDHQKREIRSKKNPPLKTCLSLSALWDRYRQNMHMDERVRGERKIRIWFLGKSTSETKVGRKEEAENCRELKINIETRRKKELRIELMRDAPMPLFLYKTTRVRVLAFAVLTEYLIRPLLMIE